MSEQTQFGIDSEDTSYDFGETELEDTQPADTEEIEADTEAESAETEADEASAGSKAETKTVVRKAGMSRQGTRKTAEKTLEVAEADEQVRTMLSLLYESADEIPEIVSHIMTSRPSEVREIVDGLLEIRDAEGMGKAASFAALSKASAKRVWSLLHHLGLIDRASMPADSLKAAMTIAGASEELDADTYANLEAAAELAKKA